MDYAYPVGCLVMIWIRIHDGGMGYSCRVHTVDACVWWCYSMNTLYGYSYCRVLYMGGEW